ncbi:unnamed protein product [Microthlaspi erraticum]|uniref:F-box domain-containing protein n=1 Tax=Microthlaspi erraticum TaxID=1685480 RepID=A0A6D2IM03_9BRAS|nr:unnamed protein product [Microthlaspi erraticum]
MERHHSRRRTEVENNPRETDEERINSVSVPQDLLVEILLRLPLKSLVRFVRVSKSFATAIRSRDFFRLYSLPSPEHKQRVLLAFSELDKEKGCENWLFFYSSPSSSSSPVFLFRKSFSAPDLRYNRPDYVQGLISFVYGEEQIIVNPSIGKSITLPLVKSRENVLRRFLGYDPVDAQYKVVCMIEPMFGTGTRVSPNHCQVMTLGLGSHDENSWRDIECSISHHPRSNGLCINGVLYYFAYVGTSVTRPSC